MDKRTLKPGQLIIKKRKYTGIYAEDRKNAWLVLSVTEDRKNMWVVDGELHSYLTSCISMACYMVMNEHTDEEWQARIGGKRLWLSGTVKI